MGQKRKLERAMHQGVIDACKVWEEALLITPGVGPVLRSRIMNSVKKIIRKRAVETSPRNGDAKS